jgi:3-oxoadipate enol-lactonase
VPEVGRASLAGASIYYEATGAGDPVVFLHGFSLDSRMWDDQVPAFSDRFRVLRYDLRGFGRSTAGDGSYTHADDLHALVDYLGLDRVALVGLSLGGGAAINFAIGYPERTRALVAVDASLGGFHWSAEFADAQAELCATAKARGVAAARAAWLASPLFGPARGNAAAADRLCAIVGDYSGRHWVDRDAGRRFSPPAIERLHEIHAPTLVIVGERDTPDFHDVASTLERGIAGARRVTMAGVGHMANLEAPQAFNRIVRQFLETTLGGTRSAVQ